MASQHCPACALSTTKELPDMSPMKDVAYYRCASCGHVWVLYKDGSVHHVTPLQEQQRAG